MTEPPSALERLAHACGVATVYGDGMGRQCQVSHDTVQALLAAMGRPAQSEAEAAEQLRAMAHEQADAMLPPTVVRRNGASTLEVPLILPKRNGTSSVAWHLDTEQGQSFRGTVAWEALAPLPPDAAMPQHERRSLPIQAHLDPGYHQLRIEFASSTGPRDGRAHVIVAPPRSYLPDSPQRRWGVGVQLYGLRSDHNQGLGSYGDLARFAEHAAGAGAGFVGISPVHALFPADPNHFGPYSPSSRRFLNTSYLDIRAIPGYAQCDTAQRLTSSASRAVARLQQATLVDYRAVARLTQPALEALFLDFQRRSRDDAATLRLKAFKAREGHPLEVHALFNALHEHFCARGTWFWRHWPVDFQDARHRAVAEFAAAHAERVAYFKWLQWLADEQLAAAQQRARAAGMPIGLYADMAVAVDHGGSAAWSGPDLVPPDISVGAPPDAFNTLGQNWGLAPFSPLKLRALGFAPFAADVAATMRHAGAIRIDHAMKLQRLFWIPPGGSGRDGAYISYPRDELLAVLALESHRNECVLIAEDLGTVPEGFRDALRREQILTYKILYFERTGPDDRLKRPEEYEAQALVATTTHDLPTLRGLLKQRDLEWREKLDLYPDAEARAQARAEREYSLGQLHAALQEAGLLEGAEASEEDLLTAIHAFVARTPCQLLVIQAEDLAGCVEQANLPGTTHEHPNWRRRLPVPVDALFDGELARRIIAAVRAERDPP
jgi:4-alpha-glucanotransferase